MPVDRPLRIVFAIFKGKGDIRNYNCYITVKLLSMK